MIGQGTHSLVLRLAACLNGFRSPVTRGTNLCGCPREMIALDPLGRVHALKCS